MTAAAAKAKGAAAPEKVEMLNKEGIVASIAAKTSLTKIQAAAALDAALSTIAEALAGGRTVRLHGIGSLFVRLSSERQSRNPRTSEKFVVPARREAKFRPAADLKEAVAAQAA